LTLLLAVHLGTNYKAVTAVALRSLNRQRANIVYSTFSDTGEILAPRQVAPLERIFEKDGMLRWGKTRAVVVGNAEIGANLAALVGSLRSQQQQHSSVSVINLEDLARVFCNEEHVLWYDFARRRVTICLKERASPEEQLRAWMHALLLAKRIRHGGFDAMGPSHQEVLALVEETLDDIGMSWSAVAQRLGEAGWDLDAAVLETVPGYRVGVCPMEITGVGKDKGDGAPVERETKKDL
jgi:hypothetical protein